MTDMTHDRPTALPDPDLVPDLYADVLLKRFLAWVVDALVIGLLVAVAIPFTLFSALFFLPLMFLLVGFLYRWWTIASRSATPGMRLMSIEFRTAEGHHFDSGAAFLHTLGYTLSVSIFPLQLVSIVLMLVSPRRQGLTDHVLGTAAINRRAAW